MTNELFKKKYGLFKMWSKWDIIDRNLITPIMIQMPFCIMLMAISIHSRYISLIIISIVFIIIFSILTLIDFKNGYNEDISEPT